MSPKCKEKKRLLMIFYNKISLYKTLRKGVHTQLQQQPKSINKKHIC